jgi:DNA-binding IclR family transcriptional regulator
VAALAAETQEALLAGPVPRLTGLTVTEPQKLRQTLAETRHRGYAIEAHAATLGEAGIAAPVVSPSGHGVAAIGIVGPVERLLAADRLEGLAEAVSIGCGAGVRRRGERPGRWGIRPCPTPGAGSTIAVW